MNTDESAQDSKSSVTMCIVADDLEPDLITNTLELIPSKSWQRGQKRPSGRVYDFGGWKLYQDHQWDSFPLDTQIGLWIEKLAPRKSQLETITSQGFDVDLVCFATHESSLFLKITHERIEQLSELHVNLIFEFLLHKSSDSLVNETKTG